MSIRLVSSLAPVATGGGVRAIASKGLEAVSNGLAVKELLDFLVKGGASLSGEALNDVSVHGNLTVGELKKNLPNIFKKLDELVRDGFKASVAMDDALDSYAESGKVRSLSEVERVVVLQHICENLKIVDDFLPGGLRTFISMNELLTTDRDLLLGAVQMYQPRLVSQFTDFDTLEKK